MKRRKFYLFPKADEHSKERRYLYYFAKALTTNNEVVNLYPNKHSKFKYLNYLVCLLKANTLILHWTENFAFLRQKAIRIPIALIYFFSLTLLKLCGKEVVWVFHNKHPHKGHNWISHLLLVYNAFISDLVVTNASEGISYCKTHYYRKANVIFLPQPAYLEAVPINCEEIYDIIIWGEIRRAKCILEFLQYWNGEKLSEKYKLLICGKCRDDSYNRELLQQVTPNILYINDFLKTADLNKYISSSKNILFTHNYSSILCSGSLVYSLPFKKNIIGPPIGAFNDFAKMGVVSIYNRFDEIPGLLNKQPTSRSKELDDFLTGNTWENFASKFEKHLNQR
ncbi:MAG: hypothetical protein LBU03_06390 [Tannerellaceae bacterium]|jgi:hypothetical protein|nr:hypothetical protein [Tannerellaceae bacterium]